MTEYIQWKHDRWHFADKEPDCNACCLEKLREESGCPPDSDLITWIGMLRRTFEQQCENIGLNTRLNKARKQ